MDIEVDTDEFYEAFKAAVKAIGPPKSVAHAMLPTKTQDAAHRALLDCLNPNRDQELHPLQVFWILRQAHDAGYHEAADYVGSLIGYRLIPILPPDEKAELQRKFVQATEQAARNIDASVKLFAQMRAAHSKAGEL